MALPQFTKDMNIISALDDEPNDVGGLTAAELKAKFDEGSISIKTFLNNTLIPALGGGCIKSIAKNGTGAAGTLDTYTITYQNDSVFIFTVYNGVNGVDGATGETGPMGPQGEQGVPGNVGYVYIVTLTSAGWVGSAAPYSQTLTVNGIELAGYAYIVSSGANYWLDYSNAQIRMETPSAANQVKFYCTTKPTNDIAVNILKARLDS